VALCAVDFVSQVEAGFRLVVAGGLLVLLVPLAISVHQTFSWHRTLAGGRAPGWTVPVMLGTLLAGIAAGALVLQLRLHDGFGVRDEAGIPESHGEVLRAMGALPKDEPILAYTSLGARAPRQGFALYSARRLVFGAEASHAMPLEDILGMELARGTSKRNPSIVVLTCLGRTESFTLDPRGGTDLEFYEGLRGAWERAREAALPDPLLRATDLETLRARGELVPVRPEDRERIRKERGLPAKQTPPPGRHAK
jgi:hypothetical protein